MQKLLRYSLSLLALLILGTSGCGKSYLIIPEIGPAFVDPKRDPDGSDTRLDEFYVVCIAPGKAVPPLPSLAPHWCAWTMQADKIIRANNEKARY